MAIEPVQFIEANGIGFTEGNAIKYLSRHANKGGAVDLKKAIHFAAMALEHRYGVVTEFTFSDAEKNPEPPRATNDDDEPITEE